MKKKGFLIDMDGVIYKGSEPIPGAVDFINGLRDKGLPFLFLTNNSQRTSRDVCYKLNKMGFRVNDTDIFTCAMATARYLASRKENGTAYVIGEGGLLTELHNAGYSIVDDQPDYVIIGEGRTIMLESVDKAINMIMKGSKLIATNLDPNCPMGGGKYRVGCGALVAMLEFATGIKAFSVGKPSPVMMRMARKALQLTTDETVMIGDTMGTDILGAGSMGFTTVLTLTGVTREEDLEHFGYAPDFVIRSIKDLLDEELFMRVMGASALVTNEY
ncbi:HAD-IIA family hydrolase [Chitinophaga oryzae]|uniref:HAD-IIA family hydrolase n=1 Tax=Chitinophaga oryzae TaxID=2725414 RepID=A0AAE6ZD68_9BACT|nr:HAD-IIA family hydrolase [Chitinophaga oryzae]QJB30469.1 HAD-IIA family hydrolase [Chitinophaga oryzae]QJB36977.1 HAD-IIA family hydrolase [Chitinophaga oryzae]